MWPYVPLHYPALHFGKFDKSPCQPLLHPHREKKNNNNNNNNNSKQLPSLKRKMQINIFFFLFKSSLGLGIHYLGCTVTISEISVADLIGRLRLKGVSFSCWRWATFAVEVITMGCCLSVDNELRKGSKERKDH